MPGYIPTIPIAPLHPQVLALHQRHVDAIAAIETATAAVSETEIRLADLQGQLDEITVVVEDLEAVAAANQEALNGAAIHMYMGGGGGTFDSLADPSADGLYRHSLVVQTIDRLVAEHGSIAEALDHASGQKSLMTMLRDGTQRSLDRDKADLEAAQEAFEVITQQRLGALATLTGNHQVVTVQAAQGPAIRVDAALAPAVEELMAHARADSIPLGGWGHRTAQRTAELRIINGCPDIFSSPSAACAVPTARPGESMHERGLAIDFTCNGTTVHRGSVCDRWLMVNAPRYGLLNFPQESWHYSTNAK